MFKERLLERIVRMEKDPNYRPDVLSVDVELQSILEYVGKILSTKQGSAIISYDFGIPDVTNFHDTSYGEYVENMEKSLEKTIMRFEPRLSNLKVQYAKQENQSTVMHFKIEAELSEHNNIPVMFETAIKPDGKVAIYE